MKKENEKYQYKKYKQQNLLLKSKKGANTGITLIALVITIIVLLILAAVSIATLTGENGILTQANNSKDETIIAQEKEQIKIAYASATINKLGEKVTASELQRELNETVGDGEIVVTSSDEILYATFTNTEHNYSIDNGTVVNVDSIPKYEGLTITSETIGVTFTKSDGTTPGDPNNIENGDIVRYGDYEYRYNQYYMSDPIGLRWSNAETQNGWGVAVIDRSKSEVGELCGNIYGKELKCTTYAFGSAVSGKESKILISPKIPNSVTDMSFTFYECAELEQAPTIPNSVTDMRCTFYGCTSLTGTITINADPNYYSHCFYNTIQPITLTGSALSTTFDNLRATANNGNVN